MGCGYTFLYCVVELPLIALAVCGVTRQALSNGPSVLRSMQIVAQRGASHIAPENTLAAVRLAFQDGFCSAVDVRLLADDTLMLLHDATLHRTASQDAAMTNCAVRTRTVDKLSWTDVRGADVGSWFDQRFAAQTPPRLVEVLREFAPMQPSRCAHVFANLKEHCPPVGHSFDPRLAAAAVNMVRNTRASAQSLTWMSASLPLLAEMKRRVPSYRALHLAEGVSTAEAAWSAARLCVKVGLDGIVLSAQLELVPASLTEWLHAHGKMIGVHADSPPSELDVPAVWEAMKERGVDLFLSNLPPEVHDWQRKQVHAADAADAARVAVGVSVAFGAACAATGNATAAEDLVDLVHSVVASGMSARVAASAAIAPAGVTTLAARTDDLARRFVVCSSTYFACDLALVLGSLACGRRPQQWGGRLAHHAIQAVANLPAIYGPVHAAPVVRRYLLLAYAAEISTIILRLRALTRFFGVGGAAAQRLARRALLGSFVLFRLLLFPACTRLIWQARDRLPAVVLRLHLAFAAAGIGLSTGWFVQLASRSLGAPPSSARDGRAKRQTP